MTSVYQECTSNECDKVNAQIPNIELPPGFELLSLTMLAQILSRPDQSTFPSSSFFSDIFYKKIYFDDSNSFDMNGPFWRLLSDLSGSKGDYIDSNSAAQIYDYSDFSENASNHIFDPEYKKDDYIKKRILSQVFNRQKLNFCKIDKNDLIINKVSSPLSQNYIFYPKSSFLSSPIPNAICIKKIGSRNCLEHVWTLYRENNKYSLYIRFYKSFYIPYRPSNQALPVAVCYFPNTFIKQIANKFPNKISHSKLPKQCLESFPSVFNHETVQKFLAIMKNHQFTIENNLNNFVDIIKHSALDINAFAKYFSNVNDGNAYLCTALSIYPKHQYKKIKVFTSYHLQNDDNKVESISEYDYNKMKDQYSIFIIWLLHATIILKEKKNADFKNVLGLVTSTLDNQLMIYYTYLIYYIYYKNTNRRIIGKKDTIKEDKLMFRCVANGNNIFGNKIFYYIKGGDSFAPVDDKVKFTYEFSSLKSPFTIPKLVDEFSTLFAKETNGLKIPKMKQFKIDKDFIQTIPIPDVFSLLCTEFDSSC
ncbi:hypothetical protein M9Y10_019154 [Tritrichomonas musculus]|uniref:DUSP domain-containing protein n=1 Tax=Tritrichomonas musculus TaxID=1915356 RepID=A0ABR2HJL5_9EUKA